MVKMLPQTMKVRPLPSPCPAPLANTLDADVEFLPFVSHVWAGEEVGDGGIVERKDFEYMRNRHAASLASKMHG